MFVEYKITWLCVAQTANGLNGHMFAILVHVIHRCIDAVNVGELKAVDVAVKSRHMEFHPCLVKFHSPFDDGMELSEPVIEQLASPLWDVVFDVQVWNVPFLIQVGKEPGSADVCRSLSDPEWCVLCLYLLLVPYST